MEKEKLTDIISLYNKYKGRKASPTGSIINVLLITLFIGIIISVNVASISESTLFGIIIGAVFSLFTFLATVRIAKRIMKSRLPALESAFIQKRKEKHLYELTDNEFEALVLQAVEKKTEKRFERRGLFYYSDNVALVILTFPSRETQGIQKISLAISEGAENVIVVCKDNKKESVEKAFLEKTELILTVEDMIKDIEWLDYEDVEVKNKRLSLDSFANAGTAKKFRNIMLVCAAVSILTERISGAFSYYSTLAVIFGVLWLAVKIYTRTKK